MLCGLVLALVGLAGANDVPPVNLDRVLTPGAKAFALLVKDGLDFVLPGTRVDLVFPEKKPLETEVCLNGLRVLAVDENQGRRTITVEVSPTQAGVLALLVKTVEPRIVLLPPPDEKAAEPADEKEAIRKVLDEQAAAWNKGDLEGFMKGYWKSERLTFFSGNDRKAGWQATLERYRAKYQGDGKEMGKLSFSELDIELLSDSTALVRGRFTLDTTKGKPTGLFTLILKKQPEGWRIVHDHTSG